MFGLSSSSQEGYFSVLFDVGSASIGVGIIMRTPKKVKLLWESRIEYGYQSVDDFDRYVRTMYATLLEAGMKVAGEGFKTVKQNTPGFKSQDATVYCAFSSPWFYGAVQTEVNAKEKPFQTTKDLVEDLQENGYSKILHTKESVSWQDVMGAPQRLESSPDRVKIEGYPVHSYEHRTAREFTVQTYYSIVSQNIQEHVEEVLQKVFPNQNIVYTTTTRVLSHKNILTSKSVGQKRRSLLLEVTGEMTCVTLIKHDVALNTTTIPLGTNHILRGMNPSAMSAKEAKSAIEVLYKKNTEVILESLPENLQTPLKDWHHAIMNSIQDVSKGVTPPTDVTLMVDTFWFPLYTVALSIPWDMPGIRRMLPLDVRAPFEIFSEQKKVLKQETGDTRLLIIGRSLLN